MDPVILLNKPFDVLCQFTDAENRPTLADYLQAPGYYPAGRLDRDSEGLVLLTNDGGLQSRITHPRHKLAKTYWVQIEGEAGVSQLRKLRRGLPLNDGPTAPARVAGIEPPALWPRSPPIRERRSIPTSWLEITLSEGRNRQVRRMTAAIGHPTLRLVRVAIGDWRLEDLAPGQWRQAEVPAALQQPPAQADDRGDRSASRRRRRRR